MLFSPEYLIYRSYWICLQLSLKMPNLDTETSDGVMIGHLRKQAGHNVNLLSDVAVIGRIRGWSHGVPLTF